MTIPKKVVRGSKASALNPADRNYVSPESREEAVRRGLRLRLKHVCEKLSSVEFEALVLRMTLEQLRGEGITGRHFRPL
jgi:hypothetical protein